MILIGDCLDALRAMPSESVDAIVTDPPYGLGRPPPAEDVLRELARTLAAWARELVSAHSTP